MTMRIARRELLWTFIVELEELAQRSEVDVALLGAGHLLHPVQRRVQDLRDHAAREVIDRSTLLVGQLTEHTGDALHLDTTYQIGLRDETQPRSVRTRWTAPTR